MLLPSDFAEHIYHVGSSHDTHSINQSGLIPGGKDIKKGRHAVFFAAVGPMFIDQLKEVEYNLTKPRIAVYKHSWKKRSKNTLYWCNLRVAQSKGLQFYKTRSNAKEESGEQFYSKAYQSPTLPARIVLKPNLHYGRQDTTRFDARTSFDHSCKHRETCGGGTYNESCHGEIDFGIQGLPIRPSKSKITPARKQPKS